MGASGDRGAVTLGTMLCSWKSPAGCSGWRPEPSSRPGASVRHVPAESSAPLCSRLPWGTRSPRGRGRKGRFFSGLWPGPNQRGHTSHQQGCSQGPSPAPDQVSPQWGSPTASAEHLCVPVTKQHPPTPATPQAGGRHVGCWAKAALGPSSEKKRPPGSSPTRQWGSPVKLCVGDPTTGLSIPFGDTL